MDSISKVFEGAKDEGQRLGGSDTGVSRLLGDELFSEEEQKKIPESTDEDKKAPEEAPIEKEEEPLPETLPLEVMDAAISELKAIEPNMMRDETKKALEFEENTMLAVALQESLKTKREWDELHGKAEPHEKKHKGTENTPKAFPQALKQGSTDSADRAAGSNDTTFIDIGESQEADYSNSQEAD